MRPSAILAVAAASATLTLFGISGCGYHTLGSATHLPPDVKSLEVPVFATRTDFSGAETAMTEAVIRELSTRTRYRVTSDSRADADAVLRGTILKQATTPLTYNSATQQTSSFVITIVASVTLTARDGRVLYQNKNYVFREQYQATTNLPTFFQEDPAAIQRLSRAFAKQLVADVLEGF
jgi:outer membrane lipopolysaccharide assembly protein LptE/RlpB